jgi:hypothetical protein
VPIFSFSTQVSINIVDDLELMELMLEAGFRHLFIGLETSEEEALTNAGKMQNTRRDMLAGISTLHQLGFIVVGGFIVGFDTDTRETLETQSQFIQDSGILMATVNMLKAPPGTPLYERIKRENRLVPGFSFAESQTNILPLSSEKSLSQAFNDMILRVYSPEFGVARTKKWLSEFKHLPDVVTDIPGLNPMEYLPVFFRAIYFIGIKYSGRRHFRQLIFWTIKHHLRKADWALVNLILIYQLHHLQMDYSETLSGYPSSE